MIITLNNFKCENYKFEMNIAWKSNGILYV